MGTRGLGLLSRGLGLASPVGLGLASSLGLGMGLASPLGLGMGRPGPPLLGMALHLVTTCRTACTPPTTSSGRTEKRRLEAGAGLFRGTSASCRQMVHGATTRSAWRLGAGSEAE